MSPHAVLGPVDPQLGRHPAASVLKVVARKPVAEIEDETLILADVAEKAIEQLTEAARELLERSQLSEKPRSSQSSCPPASGLTTTPSRSNWPNVSACG